MPTRSSRRKVAVLGLPDQFAGQTIDFLDRVAVAQRIPNGRSDVVAEDAVTDEIRAILAHHHALTEGHIGEAANRCDDSGIGIRGWNDFEQVEIAWRIEEVRSQEMAAELLGAPGSDGGNRNAGGVR